MTDRRKWILMAAILCTALPDIGAGTASPAIAAIAQAMPEVNVQLIQMIVSIPSVCLIFFPPIYAKLTMHLRKKDPFMDCISSDACGFYRPCINRKHLCDPVLSVNFGNIQRDYYAHYH